MDIFDKLTDYVEYTYDLAKTSNDSDTILHYCAMAFGATTFVESLDDNLYNKIDSYWETKREEFHNLVINVEG